MPVTVVLVADLFSLAIAFHVCQRCCIIIQILARWTFIKKKDICCHKYKIKINSSPSIRFPLGFACISKWAHQPGRFAPTVCSFLLLGGYIHSLPSPSMMYFAYLCLYASQPPFRSSCPQRAGKRRAKASVKDRTYFTIKHYELLLELGQLPGN